MPNRHIFLGPYAECRKTIKDVHPWEVANLCNLNCKIQSDNMVPVRKLWHFEADDDEVLCVKTRNGGRQSIPIKDIILCDTYTSMLPNIKGVIHKAWVEV